MQEITSPPSCVYTRLDHDIHQLVFHDSSKKAVDEFFDALQNALSQTPTDSRILLLVDISNLGTTLPSLNYTRLRLRLLYSRLPKRPPARFVVIHNYGMVVSIVKTFIKVMQTNPNNQFKFFPVDKEHEAIDWILER